MNKLYKLLVLCLLVIAGGSALKAQTMNVTDGTNTYYADDAISLNEAVTHILEDGSRTFTVNLPSDAETELFTAIRRAIIDTEGVEDGSINLTLAGVEAIPNHDEFDPSNLIFGEYLGDEGIEYVDQLASVNLPDVISIGERAFCGCENLVSITAPKAQIVSDWAFASTGISELELPEVTSIGWAAFIVCENLSTVILPKATNIGQQAFDINSLTLTSLMLLSEDDIYIEKKALGSPESFSANIDLVLNANKKDEVTNGLNWNGFAFKSIMYPCVDGSMNHTYEDVVNNGNETHSFTCTTCGQTKVESCHGGEATCMEHASCDVCGEKYGEFSEHIIDHTTGYCKFGCGEFLAGAKVTSGKTVTYYKTLDELRGNPQNGATITLLREINPEVENYRYEYIEEHNKIITVDLNGNNFNRDGYEIYVSGSEGMLTIVNTAEHRAGIVSAYVKTKANKFTVDRNVDIDAILIASNAVDAIIDLSNADFVSSTIEVSGDGFDVSQIILKNHVICDADGNEVTGELAKNVTYNLLAYGIMATVNPMNAGAVTGAGTYNDGEEATLVATPNEGYKFVNWTENDTIVSEEAEYTFIVDGNRNLVANFVTLHEVTVSVNDESFGAVTGSGVYGYGEEVTLTATPNEGYKFVNWTENDTVVSEEAEYTFVVNGNRNLVANFELLTYEVTASVNEENFGTVTGAGTYNDGEEATLVATPNEGYKFINWTENDTVVSEEAEYTFVVKGNRNLVANFVSTESIGELTASFLLYPNPANDKLNIVTETEIEEVVVYDAFGRQQLAVSCQQSAISVSGLNAGVYFVMIKTNEGVVTKRFVKK